MKSKASTANKELLEQLHKSNSSSSVVDRKALKLDSAVKTLSADKSNKKSKINEEKAQKQANEIIDLADKIIDSEKKRDIKAFQIVSVDNDKLSKFEQRAYMHKALESNKAQVFLSEDKKEHKTVYFNKATNKFEALSKDIAKERIRAHMQDRKSVV